MGSDPAAFADAGESAQRYAARMVYLTEEDDAAVFGGTPPEPMGRTLKPPVLFMSRRQARADHALCAHRATKSTEADPLRGVRGAQAGEKKQLVARRNDAAARAKRKSENKREIRKQERSPEDEPANWRSVKEAGVSFWINDVTGVATDECPHESLRPKDPKNQNTLVGGISGNDPETSMVASQMFLGTAATLIASSTAFVAPMAVRSVAPAATSSSLQMSAGSDYVATLPGAPFGDGKIFDPLGLSDGAAPGEIKKWREAEIKHGRVAMLAALGVLVAEEYHPFFMGPDYIGPAVDHFQEISYQYPEFWVFSLLGMAFIEYNTIMTAFETPSAVTGEGGLKEEYSPGDLGFDPLGLKPDNDADLVTMQTKELNNGRLAMIGIAGMLVQELVNPADILG
eukprot:g9071.t1